MILKHLYDNFAPRNHYVMFEIEMEAFVNLLSLFGSLGLFLFGMKTMSEGLEKFAGNRLRNILSAMTKNRVMGVLTGIAVTALIQSSSATTVMVVSFVNAKLMTLTQSIGVIMGANIGTTVTAWIISAIGFKVNIAAMSLPLLAVSIPLIFSKKSRRKSIGEFIVGFSFLFMGLNYLQQAATDLNIGVVVGNMLANVADGGFLTIILFVIVGALVTMIVQASAATMAVTLMLFDMHIPGFGLEQAAAIALGQNIGTTITALMASLTAGTQARRAALAHLTFNVFGVIVVLILFYPFCNGVSWFVENVMGTGNNELYKLSAIHTAFNIFNTLLLIGFVKQIEQFVCRILPMKESSNHGLKYISGGLLSTAELSILQAKKEIIVMAERCQRMVGMVHKALSAKDDSEFEEQYNRIFHYEQITDNMEMEIATYLQQVSEGRLSDFSKKQITQMMRQIDELESVGDSFFHLGRTLKSKRLNEPTEFTCSQIEQMTKMLNLADDAINEMKAVINRPEGTCVNLTDNYEIENMLNEYRNTCRQENLNALSKGKYNYRLGVFFNDFIAECEKIGDYVVNVIQAEKQVEVAN